MTILYHAEQTQLRQTVSHVIMKHVVVSHYQIIGLVVGEGEADRLIHFGPLLEQMYRAIIYYNYTYLVKKPQLVH